MKTTKKPSDYSNVRPIGSVFGRAEEEIVIRNILVILATHKFNCWANLTWDEYVTYRLQDEKKFGGNSNFLIDEKEYFDRVIKYVKPERIGTVCRQWMKIYED